jgi:competence protein ComEC
LIVPIGFFTLTTSLLWHRLAIPLARLLALLLTSLDASVQWFARWRLASYRIPGPPLYLIVAFAVCSALLAAAIRSRRRVWQWMGTGALMAIAVVIALYPFSPRQNGKDLEVTVLDVGQGDSLFVAFPGRHTMLIDGGGALESFHERGMRSGIDTGEEVVSPYLWSRGLKRIEVVALTHAHQDHLGGLPAILENFRVDELWVGHDVESAAYQNILALAAARGVRIVHVKAGNSFTRGAVSGSILWPEDTSEERAAKNDDSVVIRLTDGSRSLMLPGDIERPSERQILADDPPLSADFLKVAHHGSRTSTIDAFLSAVNPAFAAISSGKDNSFGHPSPDVVERLESAGVRVYRTDRDGAITVTTDGRALSVTTFLHTVP